MIWNYFIYFASAAVGLWAIGAWGAWKGRKTLALSTTAIGLLAFLTYMILMWGALERPPMRTMGETRLWYSFFLPLAGIIVYSRWHYKWILSFSTLLAAVFIGINIVHPELHTKDLMPALQSPWFAPHVIVYMFAYALFGAAFLMAVYLLFRPHSRPADQHEMEICDNLTSVGWAFLTIGMLFGALWAKEAWGTYWSWDPKETWAAVTWLFYLVYMHYRIDRKNDQRLALWLLVIGFTLLQMCWWGINYLPSAQASSVHTYSLG